MFLAPIVRPAVPFGAQCPSHDKDSLPLSGWRPWRRFSAWHAHAPHHVMGPNGPGLSGRPKGWTSTSIPSLEEPLDDHQPTRAWEKGAGSSRSEHRSGDIRAFRKTRLFRSHPRQGSQNHNLDLEPPRQRSRLRQPHERSRRSLTKDLQRSLRPSGRHFHLVKRRLLPRCSFFQLHRLARRPPARQTKCAGGLADLWPRNPQW